MSDDAWTSNLLHLSHRVSNHPMTTDELYGLRAFICNADGIEKKPLVLMWIGAARIILGFDVDPDIFGSSFGRRHSVSIRDQKALAV